MLIRVISAATADLVDYCKKIVSLDPQYRIPWIVFDRDQVKDFDQIIEKAEHNHIRVGWSNPCIEIWFYAYFGEMPTITESKVCCGRFGKIYQRYIKQNYNKSNKQIYSKLKQFGDELKAINLAKNKLSEAKKHYSKPSEMFSCTTVHELIEEINEKINEKISMESC